MLLWLLLSILGAARPTHAQTSATCAWDLTSDGIVSTNDLLFLLACFGDNAVDGTPASSADGNGDGLVGTADLLGLLSVFGRYCEDIVPPVPPPQPITPLAASLEFATAFATAAGDPATPFISIFSEITFEGDISQIPIGTPVRAEFEAGFSAAMASSLGDGATVTPDMVFVDSIVGGSIIVLFHIDVPESLSFAGSSLLHTLANSGTTITIAVASSSFAADTSSMAAPSVSPAVIDCVADAGDSMHRAMSNGVAQFRFIVAQLSQNGGRECPNADGNITSTQPCNTNIQCPVDCAGYWDEWSVCPVPCGGGNQTRAYIVSVEPQHGGACPQRDLTEMRECNSAACPPPPLSEEAIDCIGEWTVWSECSHTCAPDGQRQRTFGVSTPAANGGAACAGNVAIGKATTQSTTILDAVAGRAVDGNRDGDWIGNSCTHTDAADDAAWWQVDLGAANEIEAVEIFSRTGYAFRMNGVTITVSTTPDFALGTDCATISDAAGDVFPFDCEGVTGQFVTLWKDATIHANLDAIITVCEVEIIAPDPNLVAGTVETEACNTHTMCPPMHRFMACLGTVRCRVWWWAQTRLFEVTTNEEHGGASRTRYDTSAVLQRTSVPRRLYWRMEWVGQLHSLMRRWHTDTQLYGTDSSSVRRNMHTRRHCANAELQLIRLCAARASRPQQFD